MIDMRSVTPVQKLVLFAISIGLSVVVLLHVRFLGTAAFEDDFLFFWLPLLTMGFISASQAFLLDDFSPLLSIIILSMTLHAIRPVTEPDSMTWGYDSAFHLQLLRHLSQTGHWDIGFGAWTTYAYSFYPLSDIFLSVVQSITSFPMVPFIKFYPTMLSSLVLVLLYLLLSQTLNLGRRAGNLAALIFALYPYFHAKYAGISQEGYATIFFPLVLAYSISRRNHGRLESDRRAVLAVVLPAMLAIALSHHFTSYMLALAMIVPSVVVFALTRSSPIRVGIILLSLLLPLAWLVFVAGYFLEGHLFTVLLVLEEFEFVHWQVGYASRYFSEYYTSQFLASLTVVRNFLLAGLTFVGLLSLLAQMGFGTSKFRRSFSIIRVAKRNPILTYMVVSLLLFSGMSFLSLMESHVWEKVGPDIMFRPLNFAFYFIAPFAGLGIAGSLAWLEKLFVEFFQILSGHRMHVIRLVFGLLLIAIFLPSCLVQAHPRWMYDSQYHPIRYDEWSVDPEQQLGHAMWVARFVTDSDATIFAGSGSYNWARYLMAYGNQKEWNEGLEVGLIASLADRLGKTVNYITDRNNLQLPGAACERLKLSDVDFLDENFPKIYDDGTLSHYVRI